MNNYSLQDILGMIVSDYNRVFDVEPINANYIITDNMKDEYFKLRPDVAKKEPLKMNTLNRYNGVTVCPRSVGEDFNILINKNLMLKYLNDNNATWVGTIVHETTHARDYTDFALLINAQDYNDILSISKNLPFQLWTEFNARSKGYYFVRKYSFDNMFDYSQVTDIVNVELPAQLELLQNDCNSTIDYVQKAYYIAQFLGRLHALQIIFPNHFTDEYINEYQYFSDNQWIKDWYWFLSNNLSVEKLYKNQNEMIKILEENPFIL